MGFCICGRKAILNDYCCLWLENFGFLASSCNGIYIHYVIEAFFFFFAASLMVAADSISNQFILSFAFSGQKRKHHV